LAAKFFNLVKIFVQAIRVAFPFKSAPELFVPIKNPRILLSRSTNEAWFCADLYKKYANKNTLKRLPTHYEQDISISDKFTIRSTHRFKWVPSQKDASLARYRKYHQRLRKDLYYIYSPQRLLYIKRNGQIKGHISRSSMTISDY
jgi:hypothetical protein